MYVHLNLGSSDPAVQKTMHAEIKRHYQQKGPWTPARWLARRLTEIEMVLFDRYGWRLPDDDAGLDDLRIVLFHMAKCAKHNERTMRAWIAEHAPWLTAAWAEEHAARLRYVPSTDNLIRHAIASEAKKPPSRKRLAKMLGLTDAVRHRLGKGPKGPITTIDVTDKKQSTARRKRQDKDYQQTKRRALGAKPQAQSISRTKPWEALGYKCRRTWERHGRKPMSGSGVATSSHSNVAKLHGERQTCDTERAAPPQGHRRKVSVGSASYRNAAVVAARRAVHGGTMSTKSGLHNYVLVAVDLTAGSARAA